MTIDPPFIRILLIEDDPERIKKYMGWLPDDVRLISVTSAGRAIGTIKRDGKRTYAGVMLDHDLQMQIATAADSELSGSDLIEVIIRVIDHNTPILIHSMNQSRSNVMAARLDNAGFYVTKIPDCELSKTKLRAWFDEVRDFWLE